MSGRNTAVSTFLVACLTACGCGSLSSGHSEFIAIGGLPESIRPEIPAAAHLEIRIGPRSRQWKGKIVTVNIQPDKDVDVKPNQATLILDENGSTQLEITLIAKRDAQDGSKKIKVQYTFEGNSSNWDFGVVVSH